MIVFGSAFSIKFVNIHRSIAVKIVVRSLTFKIQKLNSRSLIKISGDDTHSFLQGVITNDINQLNESKKSIYTLFLNNRGRVVCDSIVYKHDNALFVECDSRIQNELKNHLKFYRVRRKIQIETAEEQLWVLYKNNTSFFYEKQDDDIKLLEQTTVCDVLSTGEYSNYEIYVAENLSKYKVSVFNDPRTHLLGIRAIVAPNLDFENVIKESGIHTDSVGDTYTMLRYRCGVGEGISELPMNSCFPLEINCDYLHGVSFHKGCYLGQELTARTHHTGVVRKRLMPLVFNSVPHVEIPFDSIVLLGNGKKVGKVRGITGKYAIGLLRISEVLEQTAELYVNNIPAHTYKPLWWPHQSKKHVPLWHKE